MLAEENREGCVRLPTEFTRPKSAKFFLLRVRGDSMNRAKFAGERIESGDLVLVRQQPTAQSGDVVVALIDGEATIKRLAKAPGYWVLKPESTNQVHLPIILNRDFAIQGVVCRVLKKGAELIGLLEE
jgi:repressor LexA